MGIKLDLVGPEIAMGFIYRERNLENSLFSRIQRFERRIYYIRIYVHTSKYEYNSYISNTCMHYKKILISKMLENSILPTNVYFTVY